MAAKPRYKKGLLLGHIELTEKQAEYDKILTDKNTKVVFLRGPAGCSKTFLSVYASLQLWNEDNKRKIMYIRTVVESAERSLGFLKGSLESKLDPYLTPLEDKVNEILNGQEKEHLISRNCLEGSPINFVRGQDWKNKTVIFDEAQNASLKELTTAVTRLNYDTKLFICGDPFQSDIKNSGFSQMCNLFDDEESAKNGIYVLDFDSSDIMRDPVISFIIERIEKIN